MLRIRGLTKNYKTNSGDVQAVKEVDLDVGVGEIVTLLGPSGCGKTTMLRCVAGLEQPDSGEIEIDGQCVFSRPLRTSVPTHRRPIAIVFQSYAIWPHMNVFENVAYPLRVSRARFTKAEVQDRVMDALDTVRIPDLAGRSATTLSGGQQQRVALARALVREPKLLLLDEPLSNLDARLREEMRLELKELFDRTGISALYVTHDHLEALVLSDRIVVMNAGAVAQQGTPRELFAQPKDEFVADFLGAGNLLPAVVQEVAAGSVRLDVGFTTLRCPAVAGVAAGAEGAGGATARGASAEPDQFDGGGHLAGLPGGGRSVPGHGDGVPRRRRGPPPAGAHGPEARQLFPRRAGVPAHITGKLHRGPYGRCVGPALPTVLVSRWAFPCTKGCRKLCQLLFNPPSLGYASAREEATRTKRIIQRDEATEYWDREESTLVDVIEIRLPLRPGYL